MPKELTYGDLKDQTGTTGPRPFLHCPECGSEFSANAADYWDRDKRAVITCHVCLAAGSQVPLRRVLRETRLVEVAE